MYIKIVGIYDIEELKEVLEIAKTQQTTDKITSDTIMSGDEATYIITVKNDLTTIKRAIYSK